jgi:trans-aconitate 2-methyltransferase
VTDWSGTTYRRLSALQDAVAADALAVFATLVRRDDESVLDVGCGDGRRTRDVADLVPRGVVLGVDASPHMIAAARPLARPGLSFVVGRAQDLDFAAEFDLVLSLNTLHWLVRLELPPVLRRLARALRQGGRAVLQLVGAGERRSLEQTAMDVAAWEEWRGWFADFPAPFTHPGQAELVSWAEEAGFTVREAGQTDHVWTFESPEAFERWAAMGFGVWTDRLPTEHRDRFVRDVVTEYTGGGSTFRFTQLRIVLELTP